MCGETSESLAPAYVGLDASRTCAIVYHKSTPLTEDEDDGTNPEHDDIDVEEEEQVIKTQLVSLGMLEDVEVDTVVVPLINLLKITV